MGHEICVDRRRQLLVAALGDFLSPSLWLLFGVTYYTGFRVNSGEYKVMGLAPYGRPRYVQAILRAFFSI